MLILADYNGPYIIDRLNGPVVPKFNWVFDGPLQDLKLSKLEYLEETTGQVIEIMINAFKFKVPASWHILICDQETMLIDTIQISDCSRSSHQALLVCTVNSNLYYDEIKLIDFIELESLPHVSVAKGSMLLHPVGPAQDNKPEEIYSCIIGPYDIYKHIVGMSAKEVVL